MSTVWKRLPPWKWSIALVPVLCVAAVMWQASRATSESEKEYRAAAETPVRSSLLNISAPSGVEPVGAPASFRDFTLFSGRLYTSGPAGLLAYDLDGKLQATWRVGLDLPAAQLGSMAAGGRELFIATGGEGVLGFDGQHFRQILPAAEDQRSVTTLLALSTGRLLLGTARTGVLVYDGRKLAPLQPGMQPVHVTALAGTEGDVWIGTLKDGVFRYHAGQLDHYQSELPDPQVLSLAVDNTSVLVGTPLGVVEFRDGRKSSVLAEGYFARAVAAGSGDRFVGTEDEGILDLSSRRANPDKVPGAVQRIARLGEAWYAATSDAIYERRAGAWKPVISPQPGLLTDRNVSALGFSSDGRLWVGYFDRGLDIVDPDLTRVAHHEDDRLFCINRIVSAPDRTAVATANGLALFDGSGTLRQVLTRKDGLLADHVTDVALRDHGMVIATPAGLSFLDSAGVRSLYVFHGLVNNHVYALASAGERTLAGTLGGVSVLDHDVVQANYTTANSGLKHNWITALARVDDGWFAGTYGAGVMRMDAAGAWHAFRDLREPFIVNPNALVAGTTRIYAGSLDHGLYVYDRASARWTNTVRGLPSRNVTALALDRGYLYVGTDNGLVRISEESLR